MILNILSVLADCALFWFFTRRAMETFAEGNYGMAAFFVLADVAVLRMLKKTFEEE